MDNNKQIAINRREATLKKLGFWNIDHCKGLPLIEDYKLCKSEDQICKRFIASLFSSMLACDYLQDRDFYKTDGKKITEQAIVEFGLKNYLFPDEKKVLVIDEFPYLVKTNPDFPSILQNAWDEVLKDHNVMLILCGSLISMMKKHALAYDSPLYGRRTAQIRLMPLQFTDVYLSLIHI